VTRVAQLVRLLLALLGQLLEPDALGLATVPIRVGVLLPVWPSQHQPWLLSGCSTTVIEHSRPSCLDLRRMQLLQAVQVQP
jgi:hypothetical protein